MIFTLDQYDAAMLDYFTIGILPEHLLEGEDVNTTSFNQNPVRQAVINLKTGMLPAE